MGKNFPRPDGSGVVQGDSASMPDRGTSTALGGNETYGFDTSDKAINRQGGITGATKSHSPDEKPGCNNRKGC